MKESRLKMKESRLNMKESRLVKDHANGKEE